MSNVYSPVPPSIFYDSRYTGVQMVKAGCTFLLPVNYVCSQPGRVTWLHNGLPLYERAGRVRIDTRDNYSTLTLTGVQKDDGGMYRIVVENAVGSADAEFDVIIKCEFLK